MISSKKTAVLVFANSSKEEVRHKTIPKGERLFDILTQETLKKVSRTGLPYFHISEVEQQGSSFGERFIHAINRVFEQGYDNVIAIGNDTPTLKTSHLLEAQRQLQLGKTVFGPSRDGGFYLMGLNRGDFNPKTFTRLPWKRFSLFDRISDVLKNTDCSIFRLPVLRDIDTTADIIFFSGFTRTISGQLLRIFAHILHNKDQKVLYLKNWFSSISLKLYFNKGSPMAFSS
ncbi:TIGR04282 family arsenosugar biosynthesis glycosyltransferase [Maribacter sp. 2304DJ31-5]|uniref:TIGR04282 family arsenosugar biosynthesis glycosyltransferase n=1 Tax=Maribacter sp. 2304DJ31-5 TaxID=3386273 RepID=UPI0039BCF4EE